MIFVSYGAHVVEKFGIVDTYTLPYALEPLRRIVDEENSNFRKGYPLNKVIFFWMFFVGEKNWKNNLGVE